MKENSWFPYRWPSSLPSGACAALHTDSATTTLLTLVLLLGLMAELHLPLVLLRNNAVSLELNLALRGKRMWTAVSVEGRAGARKVGLLLPTMSLLGLWNRMLRLHLMLLLLWRLVLVLRRETLLLRHFLCGVHPRTRKTCITVAMVLNLLRGLRVSVVVNQWEGRALHHHRLHVTWRKLDLVCGAIHGLGGGMPVVELLLRRTLGRGVLLRRRKVSD